MGETRVRIQNEEERSPASCFSWSSSIIDKVSEPIQLTFNTRTYILDLKRQYSPLSATYAQVRGRTGPQPSIVLTLPCIPWRFQNLLGTTCISAIVLLLVLAVKK
ncbi:hypothetical protein R3W88_018402 [Solanum pinnatisectum]|uniref:Uncharacterized protein n=1 Tax=Solanum pinnatisectum TaxID=50273 RepID=A0AAV9L5K2_9SOLN|nr:hypothetical protein R3W88_018402 [Solanum pinnatisectum]